MGTALCSPEEKVKEDIQGPSTSSEDVWPPREAEEDMEVTPCGGLGGPRSGYCHLLDVGLLASDLPSMAFCLLLSHMG